MKTADLLLIRCISHFPSIIQDLKNSLYDILVTFIYTRVVERVLISDVLVTRMASKKFYKHYTLLTKCKTREHNK